MKIKSQYIDKDGLIYKTEYYTDEELENITALNKFDKDMQECMSQRRSAYEQLWPTPWDWNDDILQRGIEAVSADKLAIKAKYPKPQHPIEGNKKDGDT